MMQFAVGMVDSHYSHLLIQLVVVEVEVATVRYLGENRMVRMAVLGVAHHTSYRLVEQTYLVRDLLVVVLVQINTVLVVVVLMLWEIRVLHRVVHLHAEVLEKHQV
jgi:hypothetical protein